MSENYLNGRPFLEASNDKTAVTTGVQGWLKKEGADTSVNETGIYALLPYARRFIAKEGLKAFNWQGLRDNAIQAVNETPKIIREAKDGLNEAVYRATNPYDKLINEAAANYLRKLKL